MDSKLAMGSPEKGWFCLSVQPEKAYWVALTWSASTEHFWSGAFWLDGSERESVSCDWVSPVVDTSDSSSWLWLTVGCCELKAVCSFTFSDCDEGGDGCCCCVAAWLWLWLLTWLFWLSFLVCDCDMIFDWMRPMCQKHVNLYRLIAPDRPRLVDTGERKMDSLESNQARNNSSSEPP